MVKRQIESGTFEQQHITTAKKIWEKLKLNSHKKVLLWPLWITWPLQLWKQLTYIRFFFFIVIIFYTACSQHMNLSSHSVSLHGVVYIFFILTFSCLLFTIKPFYRKNIKKCFYSKHRTNAWVQYLRITYLLILFQILGQLHIDDATILMVEIISFIGFWS